EFPVLFKAMDTGHLCLSRVRMLAAHLNHENVGELVETAKRYRRLSDLRRFLDRFTKPDLLMTARVAIPHAECAPASKSPARGPLHEGAHLQARGPVSGARAPFDDRPPPVPVDTREASPPDIPEWVELRIKAPRATWEHLRKLLSHSIPSGDASKI